MRRNFMMPQSCKHILMPERVENVPLYSDGSLPDHLNVSIDPLLDPQEYNVTVVSLTGDQHTIVVPRNASLVTINIMGKVYYITYMKPKTYEHENSTSLQDNNPNENSGAPMEVIGPALAMATVAVVVGTGFLAAYWQDHDTSQQQLASQSISDKFSNEKRLEEGDQLEVAGERITLHEVLGEGAFGLVRRGTLAPDFKDVAVKMLKDFPCLEEIRSFHAEMEMMKSVGRHAHVVGLVGCCSGHRPLILVEYCAKGDLLTYLRRSWDFMNSRQNSESTNYQDYIFGSNQDIPKIVASGVHDSNNAYNPELTFSELLSFCRQIALGMEFLASNKVVHRDLAARNVLITEDNILKIADFGLSRDVYQESYYKQKSNGKMPVKWMALESLTHRMFTTQSDVWSFGVVMWEIATMGGLPYAEVPPARLLRVLRGGYRMPRPSNCTQELYELMRSCWAARPPSRPTFSMLVARLDELLHAASPYQYLTLEFDPADRELTTPTAVSEATSISQ